MIALLFLLITFLHGLTLSNILLQKTSNIIKTIGGFLVGSILCVSFLYFLSCLTKSLDLSLVLFLFFSMQCILIFFKQYKTSLLLVSSLTKKQYIAIFLFAACAYWLFSKSFGYESSHFLIASNVYLDFGAHIPFIRSFSLGNNFPGEVPFFQNSGLLYYFLFDFYTGVLEHFGLNIDIAYNLLSSISFTCLLLLIYYTSLLFFKKRVVGILSVVLFLFNSSLSFLTFFENHGLSLGTISSWWHNNFYSEGLPTVLNKGIDIALFWNLNTYINQRHLVFGIAMFLFIIFVIMSRDFIANKKLAIVLGSIGGLLVFWHTMMYLALLMVLPVVLLLYKDRRREVCIFIITMLIVGFPQLLVIKLHSANTILFQPGFLLEHMLTIQNEIMFWFVNLGLSLFTIPLGLLVSNKSQKKLFFVFLPLFLIPNLIHLSSTYTFDDHKYFNVWILMANMYTSLFLVSLLSKNILKKMLFPIFLFFLTLSGLISIMVIKNDVFAEIQDYPKDPLLQFAKTHISPTAVILTNGEIYDPVSLVGRKTFIGRAHYVYLYGGDVSGRLSSQQHILMPKTQEDMIDEIKKNRIEYIILYKNSYAKNEKEYNASFLDKSGKKIYEGDTGIIYKI